VGNGTRTRRPVRIIHVLRKPLSESSVAANVLEHGSGALHIDASRTRGRWPSNLILEHLPECRRTGTKDIRGSNQPGRGGTKGEGRFGAQSFFGSAVGKEGSMPFYTNPEHYGLETVEAWDCAEGCPVAEVDAGGTQTRDHAKRDTHQETLHASPVKFGHSEKRHQFTYGDGGGSARYFKQVGGKR